MEQQVKKPTRSSSRKTKQRKSEKETNEKETNEEIEKSQNSAIN